MINGNTIDRIRSMAILIWPACERFASGYVVTAIVSYHSSFSYDLTDFPAAQVLYSRVYSRETTFHTRGLATPDRTTLPPCLPHTTCWNPKLLFSVSFRPDQAQFRWPGSPRVSKTGKGGLITRDFRKLVTFLGFLAIYLCIYEDVLFMI